MTGLAGAFLVAHGLLHIAIWMPPPASGAPFDPGHSWAFGNVRGPARGLAVVAGGVFVAAGLLVLAGAGGEPWALAGCGLSLALVGLTFHPWLIGAIVIDLAIAFVALT